MASPFQIPILDRLFYWYVRKPDHPAKIRILNWIKRAFRINSVLAQTRFGLMRLGTYDAIQNEILFNGGYEIQTLNLLLGLLKPGDHFLDIGANVGQYTLAAASRVGEAGVVVAVEPNPEICADLLENLALNQLLSRVSVVLAAADEKESLLGFTIPPPENRGVSRESVDPSNFHFLVPGLRLAHVLERLGLKHVDVMKIDVEGSEFRAIKGLLGETTFRPKHIVFEYIPDHLRPHHRPQDLLDYLSECGYEVLQVSGEPYQNGTVILEENLWARWRG
jgi:FkbM family methyltransferase